MMDMQITKRFSSSKMKRYRLGSSVCTRTVFLILLHTPSFLLEIRVIIKMADSKKLRFSTPPILNIFLQKF